MGNSIFKRGVIVLAMALSMCAIAIGQGTKQPAAKPGAEDLTWVKSSPAYAEIQLKRTELLSELEALLLDYQEEYPKVKELRLTLLLLDRDIARISRVKAGEASKLTLALGKLMLTRVELETDLGNLQKKYKEDHPEVKRTRKKIEIYDAAINDILN
jgi:uncharacterized protein involved in exopolysaccharide biosynthesis